MYSSTAQIMDNMALFGPGPIPIEDDPLPGDLCHDIAAASLLDIIHDMFEGTALEAYTQDITWGLVNIFHQKAIHLNQRLDDIEVRQKAQIHEQDGSEVKALELQTTTERAYALQEHLKAFEDMREAMSDTFTAINGKPWIQRSGSIRATPSLNSAIIDARDFSKTLQKKRETETLIEGPKIGFGGGRDWTCTDTIFKMLDRVHGRHPDMVLCHGGQDKGAELIASKWAKSRNVHLIVFKPDFSKFGKAAPFKRNDAMISAKLTGLVLFPGSGITLNLGQKADKAGVKVIRCKTIDNDAE